MSAPPTRPQRPAHSADALLTGLNRLKSTPLTKHSANTKFPSIPAPTLPVHKSRPQRSPLQSRPRITPTSIPQNIPYAYFPRAAIPRHPDGSFHVPRADWLEVLEHATGLGKGEDGDFAAADKLLKWIRYGRLEPLDVFRAIVAGSSVNDAALNARVLSVVAWLCVVGGPDVLPAAIYVTTVKRPAGGVRVCLDVLRSIGWGEAVKDILYDDNFIRGMKMGVGGEVISGRVAGGKRLGNREALLVAGVEAYAIALGRKLIFHQRYPEIEANYSLDRGLRKMRIENSVDAERREYNMERYAQMLSRVSLAEMALIVRADVVATDRLLRAGAPEDLCALALAEACNAWSFAEYLTNKIGVRKVSDFDMEELRFWLATTVDDVRERKGNEMRFLRRFVDGRVLSAIADRDARAERPESRHPRDVLCTFSSFEALHNVLGMGIGGGKGKDRRERKDDGRAEYGGGAYGGRWEYGTGWS